VDVVTGAPALDVDPLTVEEERPEKWSPPRWPPPGDFDRMSDREFRAFIIRIGVEANIRHALKGHRTALLCWAPSPGQRPR
jgi:hypothetical protein